MVMNTFAFLAFRLSGLRSGMWACLPSVFIVLLLHGGRLLSSLSGNVAFVEHTIEFRRMKGTTIAPVWRIGRTSGANVSACVCR